jgi:hypothetical protein
LPNKKFVRGFSYEDFALALPNKSSCVDFRTRILVRGFCYEDFALALSSKRLGSCVDFRTRICCVVALSNKKVGFVRGFFVRGSFV